MTTSIFPDVSGTVILDLRNIISDGVLRPALVVVNENGSIKTLGVLADVRDGGGHVEFHRRVIAANIGFSRNGAGALNIHPENV